MLSSVMHFITIHLVSEGRCDINSNRWQETKYTLSFSLLISGLWSSQTLLDIFFFSFWPWAKSLRRHAEWADYISLNSLCLIKRLIKCLSWFGLRLKWGEKFAEVRVMVWDSWSVFQSGGHSLLGWLVSSLVVAQLVVQSEKILMFGWSACETSSHQLSTLVSGGSMGGSASSGSLQSVD